MSRLDEVLEAHGGLERWRATHRITARARTGGFLAAVDVSEIEAG